MEELLFRLSHEDLGVSEDVDILNNDVVVSLDI